MSSTMTTYQREESNERRHRVSSPPSKKRKVEVLTHPPHPTNRDDNYGRIAVVDLTLPSPLVEPRTQEIISLIDSSDDEDEGPVEFMGVFSPPAARAPARVHRRQEDDTLLDSIRGDLSHDDKHQHYQDARRPERLLQNELDHLYAQQRCIHNRQSEEAVLCRQQINEVHAKLKETQRNAALDIYNRNNSAGQMGRMDETGNLVVDFHGLYVKDAIDKFNEMVLPILPVQKEVAIITGKGLHSGIAPGRSPLRDGLLWHIKTTEACREGRIEYAVDRRNLGKLIVRWRSGGVKRKMGTA